MPDRHPTAMPLSWRHGLATPFTADKQDAWERLVEARFIGFVAPLPAAAQAGIAAMERALGCGWWEFCDFRAGARRGKAASSVTAAGRAGRWREGRWI